MARRVQVREIETLPEADRLEGVPHPRETRHLLGHDAAISELAAAENAGRLHHAWILSGPLGIGKATLAYRFASYLLAAPQDRQPAPGDPLAVAPESIAARQVRALSHPRLFLIRRPYDTKTKRFSSAITVDAVRGLRNFLNVSSEAGDWRVVLIDSADELNVNAANAVLKSLEEPPPHTLFLLVSAEPGRLLNTIRSRCRLMQLPPLSRENLLAAANTALETGGGEPIAADRIDSLLPLANGSVRRLIALRDLDGDTLLKDIDRLLNNLPKVDWPRIHQLAEALAPVAVQERFELFYNLLMARLHTGIRAATGASPAPSPNPWQPRVNAPAQLASWAALWDELAELKAQTLALNLDRKALILETVRQLAARSR